MGGLQYRVNGTVVRKTPFPECDGEKGVLSAMVEWLRLREHEICWLVDLPTAFMELFPGDEVEIDIVNASLDPFQTSQADDAAYRPRDSKPSEATLDVWINGNFTRHIQSVRGATIDVSWIEPTDEMIERGVRRSLRLATATEPEDIAYFSLNPDDRVRILLTESPAVAAESASGDKNDDTCDAA